MKRVLATAMVLLLVSSLACAAGSPQAQGTAQINGIVKDPSGAVLPRGRSNRDANRDGHISSGS